MDDHIPGLVRFEPRCLPGAHGGPWLGESLERAAPDVSASLELCTGGESPSRVLEGPCQGRDWPELVESFGQGFIGNRPAPVLDAFEFEVRFEAADRSDGPMRALLPGKKDDDIAAPVEAVVILDARPGSKLYYGRRQSLSEERFKTLIRKSPGHEILEERAAEAGRVFLVPPGLPYALGRGLLAYVVSLSHLEAGIAKGGPSGGLKGGVIGRDLVCAPVPDSRLYVSQRGWIEGMNAVTWLYATSSFCTVRLDLRAEWREERERVGESFVVFTGLEGEALLNGGGDTEVVTRGRTVIATARCDSLCLNPVPGGAVVLKTWFPHPLSEVERPLRARSISQREIEGLYGFFGRAGESG